MKCKYFSMAEQGLVASEMHLNNVEFIAGFPKVCVRRRRLAGKACSYTLCMTVACSHCLEVLHNPSVLKR